MKKHQMVENLVLILSIHFVRFFTSYYLHRVNGAYTVGDIIFDVLLAVITTWFMVIAFTRNASLFTKGSVSMQETGAKQRVWVKCLIFFGLKLLFDGAILLSARTLGEWRYLIEDGLTIAYWLIGYALFVQSEYAVWKDKEHLRRVAVVLLLLFGASVCYDIHSIHQLQQFQIKYTDTSSYMIRFCANQEFLNSIKAVILDAATVIVLLACHRKRTTQKKADENGVLMKLMIRCDLMIALFLLLIVLKIAIAPQSVLFPLGGQHQSSEKNYETNGAFDMTVSTPVTLYPFEAEISHATAFYYEESVLLQKGNAVERFDLIGGEPRQVLTNAGVQAGKYVRFSDGTNNVYLYGHYAICYYDNGSPRIVRMDSLDQSANQPVVTALCKHLIEEGNLFAFEYAHAYLEKYDAEFITPYVERYKQGQFTDEEVRSARIDGYRLEYITAIAKGSD